MKIKVIWLCVLFSSYTYSVFCQPQKKASVKFTSSIQVGMLEGEWGTSPQLSIVNGIKYRSFFAGLGTGIDYYFRRSIPVYVSLQQNLFPNPKSPFIYVNGGVHYPWLRTSDKLMYSNGISAKGGLIYDLGIGYSFPLKTTAIFFSAGYSYKIYRETTSEIISCPFAGPCMSYDQTYEYQLRRLSIKAGFSF